MPLLTEELDSPQKTTPLLDRVYCVLTSNRFWWAVCLIWAGIYAWSGRHWMAPDGLSYQDMAEGALGGDFGKLVNLCWSPAYPALICAAFFLLRPSPGLEFPVIHLVNFLIFACGLLCFTFFLRSWIELRQTHHSEEKSKRDYFVPFSFGIFLWLTVEFITLRTGTPDLGVAAAVFAAAGICCRIALSGPRWKYVAGLGGALAIGYYFKAAMFPMSLVLFAGLILWPLPGSGSRSKVLWSGLVFLILTAPQIVLISNRVGHPSIGETGPMNYAWYVNGAYEAYGSGWSGAFKHAQGSLKHPPRVLVEKPLTLEFATPLSGTYPLHYDPAYWFEGVKARFDMGGQLKALRVSLSFFTDITLQMSVLCGGALALLFIGVYSGERSLLPPRHIRWLLVWSIAACIMYALVHAERRYLAAFLVLFWLASFRFLCERAERRVAMPVLAAVLCSLFIPGTINLAVAGSRAVRELIHPVQPDYVRVAEALRAAGVNRGDRLAVVGRTSDAYYAHYLGARIVSEIDEADGFWKLSEQEVAQIKERLSSIGVKVLVTKVMPAAYVAEGWQEVTLSDSSRICILPLRALGQVSAVAD